MLPKLGIGVWSFGGGEDDYWGPQDERDAQEVVDAALERGAVYFDTAEAYNDGRSEEALGRALKGRRERAIIGSKVSPNNTSPELLRSHCEASLRRLGTDYIDLYMVHWPIIDYPVAPAFETLGKLREEGKIRHIGLSNFGVLQMREAAATGVEIAANELYYNLLSRAIEFTILPQCEQLGIGVIAYMPLQQGLLTGKYRSADEVPPIRARTRHFNGQRPLSRHGGPGAEKEVFAILDRMRGISAETGISMTDLALSWTAHRPGITCALAGIRSRKQLDEAANGAEMRLPTEVMERLTELTEPLKHKLGADPDYFQSPAESRTH